MTTLIAEKQELRIADCTCLLRQQIDWSVFNWFIKLQKANNLYLFQFDNAEADMCGGGWSGSGQVFQKFRQMVINQGEYQIVINIILLFLL